MKDGFLKSIFKFSISTWVNFIIGILSSYICTRVVSPEIYGLFNVFNTTVTMVMYICSLGLDSSLLRFYNEPPKGEKTKIFSFKLIMLSAISTVAIAFIVCNWFYSEFSSKIFGYASYYLVVMTFICILTNLILRYLNVIYRMSFNAKQYTIQNILIQTITRFCIIAAVVIEPTFECVVLVQTIGLLLLVIIYIILQRKQILPGKSDVSTYRELMDYKGYGGVFKFALFSAPTYVLTNLNLFFSQQVIRWSVGAYALGIYSSASYFVTLLNVVNGGFTTFWAAYVYGNYEEQHEKITQMHEYMMLLMGLVFSGMMLFKDVIYLLIGSEYHASKVFVALVLIPPIIEIIAQTTIYGINIQKKNYILLIDYCILVALNIILSLLWVDKYGLVGVAFASVVASLVSFSLNTLFAQRYYITMGKPLKTIMMIINLIAVGLLSVVIGNVVVISIVLLVDIMIQLVVYRKEVMFFVEYIMNFFKKTKNK